MGVAENLLERGYGARVNTTEVASYTGAPDLPIEANPLSPLDLVGVPRLATGVAAARAAAKFDAQTMVGMALRQAGSLPQATATPAKVKIGAVAEQLSKGLGQIAARRYYGALWRTTRDVNTLIGRLAKAGVKIPLITLQGRAPGSRATQGALKIVGETATTAVKPRGASGRVLKARAKIHAEAIARRQGATPGDLGKTLEESVKLEKAMKELNLPLGKRQAIRREWNR